MAAASCCKEEIVYMLTAQGAGLILARGGLRRQGFIPAILYLTLSASSLVDAFTKVGEDSPFCRILQTIHENGPKCEIPAKGFLKRLPVYVPFSAA